MKKNGVSTPYQTQEMYAFAATVDDEGQQRLRDHLNKKELESVGVFEATGCDVFEDRMSHLGPYVLGTVFQVGHGATQNIIPRVVSSPQVDSPEDWQ